jgi:hypothetical protein
MINGGLQALGPRAPLAQVRQPSKPARALPHERETRLSLALERYDNRSCLSKSKLLGSVPVAAPATPAGAMMHPAVAALSRHVCLKTFTTQILG